MKLVDKCKASLFGSRELLPILLVYLQSLGRKKRLVVKLPEGLTAFEESPVKCCWKIVWQHNSQISESQDLRSGQKKEPQQGYVPLEQLGCLGLCFHDGSGQPRYGSREGKRHGGPLL